jgi:hypothetical protein
VVIKHLLCQSVLISASLGTTLNLDGFRLQEEQVLLKDWQKHPNTVALNTQMLHNWVRLMAFFCQIPVNFDSNPRTDRGARQVGKKKRVDFSFRRLALIAVWR